MSVSGKRGHSQFLLVIDVDEHLRARSGKRNIELNRSQEVDKGGERHTNDDQGRRSESIMNTKKHSLAQSLTRYSVAC